MGGSHDSVVQDFTLMSYFYSKPFVGGDSLTDADELLQSMCEFSPPGRTIDRAIDSALRGVPLPDGLMSRLGRLIRTMPDEAAGQVDYLGC